MWLFYTIVHAVIWYLVGYAIWRTLLRPNHYQSPRRLIMKKAIGNDLVDIAGQIVGETERAWRFYDGTKTEWVPKSQCEWDEMEKVMSIPTWLAYEKGFS